MRFLQNQESMKMILLCLFSVLLFTTFIQTELLSLPGCPGKCGNLTIPFPFGMNSNCYFDDSFHIICNSSFRPPRPFLRLGSAEVVSISLDGKLEVLNSSSGLEKRDPQSVPVVIHWAAGNVACHVARNNASRYACQSPHSQCKDSSGGQGYICRCLPGYQGNPYLSHGCQDIDECAVSNPCEGVCINLVGSFKCYCPKGYVGDGRKDGTGCHPQEGMKWSAFPLGLLVVAPVMTITWIVWTEKEKKLEKLRADLFEKNGGNVLKSKLCRRRNRRLRIYTAQEIKSITNSYDSRNVMLRCNPGTFYRGTLSDDENSIEVVVVMVDRVAESQIEQFVDQLIFLSQPHRNLVRVIGCCLETQSPFLVYELHGDGNATLFDCIRCRAIDSPFLCAMRLKAAAGVARGLSYLNSHGFRATFVHSNICSANIVMDGSSFDPKIFYAAGSNLIARDASSSGQENNVYKDPDPLNKKSDVYSFGVVLVELLTGGKTLSPNRGESGRNMALDFVYLAKAGRLREILDEKMIAEADARVVTQVAILAERCLNVKPSKRPNMKDVEAKLSTFPFPFGMNSDCYFDDSFHIICNSSFKPPKPFLRLGRAEVLNISLDGKLEILNTSSSQLVGLEKRERESVRMVIQWAAGNVACHVARNNASRYACQSPHSQCKDSSAGQGYICRCLPGYQGNPYLADGCQDIDECAVSNPCEGVCINLPGSFKCYCPKGSVGDGRKDGTGCHTPDEMNWSKSIYFPIGKLGIYTIIAIFVVAPMLATTWIAWTERQKKLEKHREALFEQNGGNRLRTKLSKRRNTELTIYTAQELKSITNSYTTKTLMLRCNAGAFYRGTLSNNDTKEVVVMMINRVPQSQIKQFVDQLIFLSQNHTNLVRIIGCCLETQSPLIVYELRGDENATLFHCIRSRDIDSPFSCEMRLRAAAGVARGLAYMNSHKSKPTFVHGNICSANIVMDSSYNAKIFYAAGSNLITRDTSSSLEQENCVYKDPELIRTGCLNKKSDSYSFGVVLAELLTGGKAISPNRRAGDRNMALDLDEEMKGEGDGEVVREVAALAERCLNIEPSKRPKMKEVAAKLSTTLTQL